MLRIELVNPVLEANFLRRWRDRLVVQAGAIQAQQFSLNGDREFGTIPVQESDTLFPRKLRGQIFF